MNLNKVFLVVFFICISPSLTAQNFHGGIMAGLVGSQVAGDTYSGFDKAGIFAGGYVSWDFTKRSALVLELEYFQKGSRKNPDAENNDYDSYLFRVNYVELPVLYQFKIDWFKIEAGPSMGVLLGYFEKSNEEVISDQDGYNKPAPVTFQINLGFRFNITPKFGIIFRTNNSLFNIRTENRGSADPTQARDVWRLWGYGQFNDALVFSAFYQFK